MKTPLGIEVDLGPGLIVLDGVLAVRERATAVPSPLFFGPCLMWPRLPISATAELLSVRVTCGHGSLILCQHCNMLCTSSFVDDIAFPHNGLHGVAKRAYTQSEHILKVTDERATPGHFDCLDVCLGRWQQRVNMKRWTCL